MPVCTFICIRFTLAANAFYTRPHWRRNHSCSGVHQLGRSEFLSVAVKRIACLFLCVPSTHLGKGCSSLEHVRPEMDFFFSFFTTHKLEETTLEKCSTFCTHLVIQLLNLLSGLLVVVLAPKFASRLHSTNPFLLRLQPTCERDSLKPFALLCFED